MNALLFEQRFDWTGKLRKVDDQQGDHHLDYTWAGLRSPGKTLSGANLAGMANQTWAWRALPGPESPSGPAGHSRAAWPPKACLAGPESLSGLPGSEPSGWPVFLARQLYANACPREDARRPPLGGGPLDESLSRLRARAAPPCGRPRNPRWVAIGVPLSCPDDSVSRPSR
jgi:hypothetical protein